MARSSRDLEAIPAETAGAEAPRRYSKREMVVAAWGAAVLALLGIGVWQVHDEDAQARRQGCMIAAEAGIYAAQASPTAGQAAVADAIGRCLGKH